MCSVGPGAKHGNDRRGNKTIPAIFPRSMINKMADEEAVPLENDFHVSSDINLDVEGDIRVQGISSDDEDSTTLDEPISVTLVCLFLFFLTAKLHYFL